MSEDNQRRLWKLIKLSCATFAMLVAWVVTFLGVVTAVFWLLQPASFDARGGVAFGTLVAMCIVTVVLGCWVSDVLG